jgi:signal peptidase I
VSYALTARLAVRIALAAALVGLLWLTRGLTSWPQAYYMTGPSMAPTVGTAGWFLARPLTQSARPGELVVVDLALDDSTFHVLRRAVGLPGDTLAMRGGRLLVNGAPAGWPARVVNPRADRPLDGPIAGSLYEWGPVTVGPDSVFVLSDTRDMFGWPDSRFLGAVPARWVRERVIVVLSRGRRDAAP